MVIRDADYYLRRAKTLAEAAFNVTIDLNADKFFTDLFGVFAVGLEELMDQAIAATTRRTSDLTGDALIAEAEEIGITNIQGTRSTCNFLVANNSSQKITLKSGAVVRVNSAETASYWTIGQDTLIQSGQTVSLTLYSKEPGSFLITTGMPATLQSPVSGIAIAIGSSSTLGLDPLNDDAIKEEMKKKENLARFGNDYFVSTEIKKLTGLFYVKVITNPNYDSKTIGTHSLPGGNMMVIIHPGTISDNQLSLVGACLVLYVTPGTTIYVPASSDDGAAAYTYDPYGNKLTYGVVFSEPATLDFNIVIVTRGAKNSGALYTVEELRPAIKASITNLMNRLLSTNPLAVTVSNQQFITACVSLQGCVKVNVTVSVNGGSFTSNDLSFAELEYPVVRNFNIT